MPNGVGRALDQFTAFRAGNLPLGAWVVAAGAEAVAEAGGRLVGGFLTPVVGMLASPVGKATVAWAVGQLRMVRDFLGPQTADIVSIIAGKAAIDELLGVRAFVARTLATIPGLAGTAPGVSRGLGQPPVNQVNQQPRLFVGDVARKASGVRL